MESDRLPPEWKDRGDNLVARFPDKTPKQVVHALLKSNGHGGHAAAILQGKDKPSGSSKAFLHYQRCPAYKQPPRATNMELQSMQPEPAYIEATRGQLQGGFEIAMSGYYYQATRYTRGQDNENKHEPF